MVNFVFFPEACNEYFTQLTYMLVRGNKFGETHDFNLVEACQQNICFGFDSNLLKINPKKQ